MGRISSSIGLVSGIPIVQTVDQLVALQARPRDLLRELNDGLQAEQFTFTEISARLLSFQLSAIRLRSASLFSERSVTSSDSDVLSVTNVRQPVIGTYRYTPLQLVQSQQLLSSGFVDDSSPVGEGTFSFGFGGFVDPDSSLDLINGGAGFARGKIRIADRSGASAEIDLRFARTVDDVLEAVNTNAQINVTAEVRGDGFRLIDQTGLTVANLKVQEVGGGTTAASLGLGGVDVAANEAIGADVVRLFDDLRLDILNDGLGVHFDSFLADLEVSFRDNSNPLKIDFEQLPIAGTSVTATVNPGETNSEVTFTAVTGGSAFEGIVVQFVDDATVAAGGEQVFYDDVAKTLTFKIDAGNTTAKNVVDALNNDSVASEIFTAALAANSAGSGLIDVTDTATTRRPLASAVLAASGSNNDLIFEAAAPGTEFADVTITLIDNGLGKAGSEFAVYDSVNKTLTVTIQDGQSTANQVIAAVSAEGTFTARLDLSEAGNDGGGTIQTTLNDPQATATTSGGVFVERITETEELTLRDVLATLNQADPSRLLAAIAPDGDRIILTDLTADSGGTFSVTDLNDSHAAEDLGIATSATGGVVTGQRILAGPKTVLLSNLNGNQGIGPLGLLQLTDRSGQGATVDLSLAETLEEVIDAINDAAVGIRARVNDVRNGIVLADTTGQTTGNLAVANGDATNSADALGIAINGAVGSVDGGDLELQVVSENTQLSSLNGGGGVARGTLIIADSNGTSRVLDLNSPDIETVGDVLIEIDRLGLAIDARINDAGDGIVLIDTGSGGSTLQVTEGSTSTAADLHILGTASQIQVAGGTVTGINGSTDFTVTIGPDDTLLDLVATINDLDAGVTATTFNDGSIVRPFRLLLSSQRPGRAGQLLIDTSTVNFSFSETVAAQDAVLLFGTPEDAANGVLATSNTNVFKDLLPETSIEIHQVSVTAVTINVSSTSDALTSAVQSVVDDFNDVHGRLDSVTTFDSESGATGLLFGDSRVLRIENDLANLLSGRFFGIGPIQSLAFLGIRLQSDGSLSLDAERLQQRFEEDPDAVEQFFSDEELGFSAKLEGVVDQLAGDEDSLLINRLDSLATTIEANNQRILFLDDRLEQSRTRLLNDFLRMEQAIAKMQNSLNALAAISPLPPISFSRSQ